MSRATAAAAASDVRRNAVPAESLKSSIMRPNIGCLSRAKRPPLPPSLLVPSLPAPRRADQEAKPERQPDGRERPLLNDVFQRFLDRIGGVLGGIHHGAAALRHVLHHRIGIGAGLLVAASRLLL